MSQASRKLKKTATERAYGDNPSFFTVPREFTDSECFLTLSPNALKVYICLCKEYHMPTDKKDGNNGDLAITQDGFGKKYKFASRTLSRGIKELKERKIIIVSRYPTCMNEPVLYALTTHSIDFVKDPRTDKCKHDLTPTNRPTNEWREWKPER